VNRARGVEGKKQLQALSYELQDSSGLQLAACDLALFTE